MNFLIQDVLTLGREIANNNSNVAGIFLKKKLYVIKIPRIPETAPTCSPKAESASRNSPDYLSPFEKLAVGQNLPASLLLVGETIGFLI